MFYAVCRHEGLQVQVPIRKDNVVTRCVKCGKAMPVDLEDLFEAGDVHLNSTGEICEKCSGEANTCLLVSNSGCDVLLKAIKGLMEDDAE